MPKQNYARKSQTEGKGCYPLVVNGDRQNSGTRTEHVCWLWVQGQNFARGSGHDDRSKEAGKQIVEESICNM